SISEKRIITTYIVIRVITRLDPRLIAKSFIDYGLFIPFDGLINDKIRIKSASIGYFDFEGYLNTINNIKVEEVNFKLLK
ncbi:hypothetical protein QBC39DRAFT_252059, partial [Podospora conica]